MKNNVLFDIPTEVATELSRKALGVLMEWLDDKYYMTHENGRYETANLVESYWRDYLSNKYGAEASEHEKHWLDCARKIKEYDLKKETPNE